MTVTAADAVFSLKRAADPNGGGFYSTVFDRVKSIDVTGDKTFKITLSQPDYWLLGELSSTPGEIVEAKGFRQISDSGALEALVDEVLAANPAAVADYRAGKPQAVGFLVGQVMKASRGQANAALVQATLRARLENGR